MSLAANQAPGLTLRQTLPGHERLIYEIAWSPDGRTLASASEDTTIRLWNPETGTRLGSLAAHTHWVRSVAWSPDGRLLASGSSDATSSSQRADDPTARWRSSIPLPGATSLPSGDSSASGQATH